jgi:hypothetical protein
MRYKRSILIILVLKMCQNPNKIYTEVTYGSKKMVDLLAYLTITTFMLILSGARVPLMFQRWAP